MTKSNSKATRAAAASCGPSYSPFRTLRQTQATVRFETEPGEQAQVDWGHFGYINHRGHQRRLYAFVMTLGWSRAMYVEFTVSADAAWWLRCHQHAFQFLRRRAAGSPAR